MMLEVLSITHVDHALNNDHLEWLTAHFAEKNEFFIATVTMPDHLPDLTCGLYGPSMGDAPVEENEVHYTIRGQRKCSSRIVKRPLRPTRTLTVIAGPHEGKPCVLYTAYGGPPAPREPGDPSLKTWDEIMEARTFWASHALAATPSMWIRTDADVETFIDLVNKHTGGAIAPSVLATVSHELKNAIRGFAPGKKV